MMVRIFGFSDSGSAEEPLVADAVMARALMRLCSRIGLTDERDDPDGRFVQRLGARLRSTTARSAREAISSLANTFLRW